MNKKIIVLCIVTIVMSIVIINKFVTESLYITISYQEIVDNENKQVEIFYDIGKKFNENDKISSNTVNNSIQFKIKKINYIKGLRIDPGNKQGNVFIKNIILQYGSEKIIINNKNFNDYLTYDNIKNLDLASCISFIAINNDPILYVKENIIDKIDNTIKEKKIKNMLVSSIIIVLIYFLLLVVYMQRSVISEYSKKIINSGRYKFIIINVVAMCISMFFLLYIYDTLIEIHFKDSNIPFDNEITVYQPIHKGVSKIKTQFDSIIINGYKDTEDIIVKLDFNKFAVKNISIRQNTHLTFNVKIKYNTNKNYICILQSDIKKYKIIYVIINVLMFNMVISILYCLLYIMLRRKFIKINTMLYGILLCTMIFIIYNNYIIFDRYYIFRDIAGDSLFQLFPYIQHLAYYIYEYKIVPFISFYAGAGMNIFSFVMEPFYLIVALFGYDNVPAMIGYMHVLRVFLAGMFFYLFLKEKGYDNYTSVIFGLLYAFSGRMISQGAWQTYPNEVVGVALFLYAFELLYNNKNKFILPLAIGLLFAVTTSYYFVLYTIIIIAYTIFRFFIDNDRKSMQNKKKYIDILFSYIIGFCFASPLILSNLIMIRSGIRSGNFHLLTDINYLKNAILQITSSSELYTAFFKTFSPNIFGITKYFGSINYLEDPVFYCGILTIILIPFIYNYTSVKEKIAYSVIIAFILIYIFSPFVRYALSGFSVNHWKISSFWIVLAIIYIASHSLSCIYKNRNINKTMLFIITIILVSMIGMIGYKRVFVISYYYIIYIFVVLYSIVLFIISKKNINKLMSIILVLVVAEISIMSWETANNRETLSLLDSGYKDGTERAIKFIEDYDKKYDKGLFYRIEKDYYTKFYNDSVCQLYRGTASYNNMSHRKEYSEMLDMFNITKFANSASYYPSIAGNVYLESLLNIKYKILKNSNIPYFYEKIGNEGNLYIVKNKLFLPFGIFYTKNIGLNNFMTASVEDRWLNSLKYNILNSSDEKEIFQVEHNYVEKYKINELEVELDGKLIFVDNNTKIKIKKDKNKTCFKFNYNNEYKNVYFLKYKIKTNTGTNTKIDVSILNGEKKDTHSINVMLGSKEYIHEFYGYDYNVIEFNNSIDYEISDFELYIIPEKIYYRPLEDAINNLKKYNFNIEKFSDNNIIGNIYVDKKGTLMFSIPYDNGWKAYVNGKQVNLIVSQVAFMGLELDPGNYKIELKFCPPGLKIGFMLFIVGIMMYILYIYIIKKGVINGK